MDGVLAEALDFERAVGGIDMQAQGKQAHGPAQSMRTALVLALLVAVLSLSACVAGAEVDASGSPPSDGTSSEESQMTAAVAELYPGFEVIEFLGKENGVYTLAARRDTAPSFVARLGLIKGSDWNESTTIDGTIWSTDGLLSEAASDASLLVGSLQTQTLETIAADAGLAGGSDGRYVHEIRTISNVDLMAFVLEPDGQYSSYTYKLDMRQSPHRFVLESKAENR